MDQGWAVVVGAVIALVGAIGAPWLRDAVTRRRSMERERQELLRDAIAEHLDAVILAHGRSASASERTDLILRAHVAGVKLALLLNSKEVIIEQIGEEAIALAPAIDTGEDVRIKGLVLVTAYQMTVLGWVRGEIPTSHVRGAYNSWCVELDRMDLRDPFRPAQTRTVEAH